MPASSTRTKPRPGGSRFPGEAEYYGAMDGANKFVRGDAIAGIIITLINILGGLAIGVFQNKMSFADAAQTYTLLTVGDGLVTQLPALIISTAAGIIVTRAGTESSLGDEITSQVLFQPRAIGMAGAVLFGFAIIPGLPTVPFITLVIVGAGLWPGFPIRQEANQEAEWPRCLEMSRGIRSMCCRPWMPWGSKSDTV